MTHITSRTWGEVRIEKRSSALGVFLTAFFLFAVTSVAVWSLVTGAGYVAPALWLALVAFGFYVWLSEGIQTALVNLLGDLSSDHFVDCFERDEGGVQLRVGFRIFDRTWSMLLIPLEDLESLEWSTGQATGLAGKDMNDWHITLWYDHHGRPQFSGGRKPDQNAYCLPQSGRRKPAESLGNTLAEMLRSAGASLSPNADGSGYERNLIAP